MLNTSITGNLNEVVAIENETLLVTFNSDGLILGYSPCTFSDNAYDEFVYILQKYELRNLVEYTDRFTVTHLPLIEELKQLHGTHAGMNIVSYSVALELFKNGTEIYNLYDDGSDGLVEEIESIHTHNGYGGEFGHE